MVLDLRLKNNKAVATTALLFFFELTHLSRMSHGWVDRIVTRTDLNLQKVKNQTRDNP